MDERVYDVFARKNRGEPLYHVGYLSAPDDELARVYAWNTYDEENWFEMCIVARSDIIAVNRTDGPFAPAGRSSTPAAGGARP
jgi:1,2-phenylacetyl-CoA epoxidase PaaB subunit